MPTTRPATPHKQDRSRATAERLLSATIQILDEAGLEGAVVPRIAALAGVAPASVYRRFADKDALLRAAFLHALRLSGEANGERLEKLLLRDSLDATARQLMAMLFEQYRRHPRLLRALSRFVDADSDKVFVHEARSLIRANVEAVVDVVLTHRNEIAHADPRGALQFAVLNAACSIEVFALDPNSVWHAGPAIADDELAERLCASFVAYLQTSR